MPLTSAYAPVPLASVVQSLIAMARLLPWTRRDRHPYDRDPTPKSSVADHGDLRAILDEPPIRGRCPPAGRRKALGDPPEPVMRAWRALHRLAVLSGDVMRGRRAGRRRDGARTADSRSRLSRQPTERATRARSSVTP